MRGAIVAGLLLWTLALTAFACADGERPAEHAAAAVAVQPLPRTPTFRVVAFTDLSGYLEPCGCTSRPLGGIDKAAEQISRLREQGFPMLVVSAGDLFFGDLPEGAASAQDAKTQETLKADALSGILGRMGLSVATPGPKDLAYGADTLKSLAARGPYRIVPEGPSEQAGPERVAAALQTVGDIKVGVIGVSTFASPATDLERPREQALMQETQARVSELRAQGARWVVVLLSGTQRLGRRMAGGLQGADFLLLGGVHEAEALPPARVGTTFMLRGARQGHGLVLVEVFARGDAAFGDDADLSTWTQQVSQQGAGARIEELAARVAAWENDPKIDPAQLAEQRARLAKMRGQAAQALQPTASGAGSYFKAQYLELESGLPGDAAVRKAMDDYNARVNEHNKLAFADRVPKPAPAGTASYVGAERCKKCHADAYNWWTHHEHGRAFSTLQKLHKEFNLSCVGCHVTGYEQPGGSTVTHNEGLTHVGCESCHGAGSLHASDPDQEPAIGITRSPTQEQCVRCHSPEHSDKFVFAEYRKHVLAPGHGLPMPSPGEAPAPAAKHGSAP